MILRRFGREFTQVMQDMKDNEENWDESQPITYQQVGNCLTTMGFLSQKSATQNVDRELLNEFW